MFDRFTAELLQLMLDSFWETVLMVGISGLLGTLIGLPLGVYLRLTDAGGVLENRWANRLVGTVVNAVRSTPFIILLVAVSSFSLCSKSFFLPRSLLLRRLPRWRGALPWRV